MNSVFIHIPKTGGLTIERALNLKILRTYHRLKNNPGASGHISLGHMWFDHCVKKGLISEEFARTSFKYAFCRNPYDRAVSHWKYVMWKHPDLLARGTSFLDFSRNLEGKREFRQQYLPIENIKMDYIGRFENLEDEIQKLSMMLGIVVHSVPHMNSTDHRPYYEYYCQESKERIEEHYKRDFEIFGYEYDNNLLHR